MKIALVHDHLAQLGGAEQVLKALADTYPSAPIYTLLYKQAHVDKHFHNKTIYPSFIQKMPLGVRRYQWYVPLMATAIESYNLEKYNVVISSASSFAKGVITNPNTTHICYCHTPTRYLWHYSNKYLDELKLPKILKNILSVYISKIRQWDLTTISRVNYFIANSKTTQQRIKKYYRRNSVVIYPPVNTNLFSIAEKLDDYFITGGRLTPYKRFDLVVEVFNKLNLPLKIFGDGPDIKRLKKMARENIEFIGFVDEQKKINLLQKAQAFIHPQEEDFGITAVEAMASGRPVIAYNKGGATETVVDTVTGLFFTEQTWEALADIIIKFKYGSYNFDPQVIKAHAEKFSATNFQQAIKQYVERVSAQ